MIIKEGERIDELQRNGYRIIQKTNGFCFGMDAVLLSGFASVKPGEKALDLGTGTGIIPILLEAKTEGSHFTGLEIQAEMAEMASRSVALNRLEEKVSIVQGDIKEVPTLFEKASFDVVTTNPPYMNDSHGLKNPDLPKAIARHEVLCNLEDVVRAAASALRPGGRLYMVHRPPADAALMMQLGAEGVFVGSGIFKSGNPEKRASAIVQAVTNYKDAKLLAAISEDLGEAMVGINENEIAILMAERGQ